MLCDMIEYAKVEKEEIATNAKVEKATEVARNLLKMNMPVENIAEATGLTASEVEGLL